MELSEILNFVLGGSLLATVVGIVTLRATVRKANAEAEKAKADAETVRIDNAEHATRILVRTQCDEERPSGDETRDGTPSQGH